MFSCSGNWTKSEQESGSISFCTVTWTRKRSKNSSFGSSRGATHRQTERSAWALRKTLDADWTLLLLSLDFHSLSLALALNFTTCSPALPPEGTSVTRAWTTNFPSSGNSLGRPRISTLKINPTLLEKRHGGSLIRIEIELFKAMMKAWLKRKLNYSKFMKHTF